MAEFVGWPTDDSLPKFSRSMAWFVTLALWLAGCASDTPANPSFPLSLGNAQVSLDTMRRDRKALDRPLIVAGGFGDPGWGAHTLADRIRPLVSNPDFITWVTFFDEDSFESCRESLLEKVEQQLGRRDVEVDVIGISMGGLVARYAAQPRPGVQSLRIARLFTICTPHQGARMASLPTFDSRQKDMRIDSDFLQHLNDSHGLEHFELVPYCRLNDPIVGESLTAPPGMNPWWVGHGPSVGAHFNAHEDPRIVADIARRLRNEPSWTHGPAAALPGSAPAASENPLGDGDSRVTSKSSLFVHRSAP